MTALCSALVAAVVWRNRKRFDLTLDEGIFAGPFLGLRLTRPWAGESHKTPTDSDG
jgi:hypothetical protein